MKQATQEQLRARHAWHVVEEVRKNKRQDFAKGFATETKRLPIRIRTAGLGQALRFVYAKSDGNQDYRSRLLVALGEWILNKRNLAPTPEDANDSSALLLAIINNDANLLRRATEEALLYLQWLTRFCEATIKEENAPESR